MKTKTILPIIITILLISCCFSSASLVSIQKTNHQLKAKNINNIDCSSTNGDDIAYVPTWSLGNYWKYNMSFRFSFLDVINMENANVDPLWVNLTEKTTEEYTLQLDGTLHGKISVLGIINKQLIGHITGEAHINRSDLALKDFSWDIQGTVKSTEFNFYLLMGFNPCFGFLNFPLGNTQKWNATTTANMNLHVKYGILPPYDSEVEDYLFETNITYKGQEDVENPQTGKTYKDCFHVSGDKGNTSHLYYSNETGYLVKVNEEIEMFHGVAATYNLMLLETNYDPTNEPPEKPSMPKGVTTGIVGVGYTFTTNTTDPEEHKIKYWFDWGDGSNSGWLGPYASNETVSESHAWGIGGVHYDIRVKAKDSFGLESEWSHAASVYIDWTTVTVTVHTIKALDNIDGVPYVNEDKKGEWFYTITAESPGYDIESETVRSLNDDLEIWEPHKESTLRVYSREVIVEITLKDSDISCDDTADISSKITNGDDLGGRVFHGKYDLKQDNTFVDIGRTTDYIEQYDGWWLTSGELDPDGSDGPDESSLHEDDAEVWFEITDSYDYSKYRAQLWVNTTRITFKDVSKDDIVKGYFTIENIAELDPAYWADELNWVAECSESWILVNTNPRPLKGGEDQQVEIEIDMDDLTAGNSYGATITINSNNGTKVINIVVTIKKSKQMSHSFFHDFLQTHFQPKAKRKSYHVNPLKNLFFLLFMNQSSNQLTGIRK